MVLDDDGVLRPGRAGVAPDEHVAGHPTGDELPVQMAPAARVLSSGWVAGGHQVRMLTARATTIPTVASAMTDCMAMSALAIGVSGIVSVGLKAVALVSEVYR